MELEKPSDGVIKILDFVPNNFTHWGMLNKYNYREYSNREMKTINPYLIQIFKVSVLSYLHMYCIFN